MTTTVTLSTVPRALERFSSASAACVANSLAWDWLPMSGRPLPFEIWDRKTGGGGGGALLKPLQHPDQTSRPPALPRHCPPP